MERRTSIVLFVQIIFGIQLVTATATYRSWGDPHITTIDGYQYEFHGHGEYVFLKGTDFEIQARTDYLTPGNEDSTVFVAFAIKDTFGTIEVHLNRTSGVLDVYQAGIHVCQSSDMDRPAPCGLLEYHMPKIRGVLAGADKIFLQTHSISSYLKSLLLEGGSDMSLTMEGIKPNISHESLKGLAGGAPGGKIVASNWVKYDVNNNSPLQLFIFGESWHVAESQSLFNYSIHNGNYSHYNKFSRPTFYEEYTNNLTALFNLNGHTHSDSEIEQFNNTCNELKVRTECLLAIARSHNRTFGEIVNDRYRDEKFLYDLQHNTAPSFTVNMPKTLDVYLADNASVTLDLSKYTYDNNSGDSLTFRVETRIPDKDWTLDNKTGVFNWTITQTLRNMTSPISITFLVHDRFNSTINSDIRVSFCGCNESSQCSISNPGMCNCQNKYLSGRYCELNTNPCLNTTCYNQSLCDPDAVTMATGPCAPCPQGRVNEFYNDEQKCLEQPTATNVKMDALQQEILKNKMVDTERLLLEKEKIRMEMAKLKIEMRVLKMKEDALESFKAYCDVAKNYYQKKDGLKVSFVLSDNDI